mmetsp:Transcript_17804/g.54444  ORF Transcript_17804/g.54444 Transcript_17804/m.54444 type:complete len:260 (+) Transcript_17804:1827-2606(+)
MRALHVVLSGLEGSLRQSAHHVLPGRGCRRRGPLHEDPFIASVDDLNALGVPVRQRRPRQTCLHRLCQIHRRAGILGQRWLIRDDVSLRSLHGAEVLLKRPSMLLRVNCGVHGVHGGNGVNGVHGVDGIHGVDRIHGVGAALRVLHRREVFNARGLLFAILRGIFLAIGRLIARCFATDLVVLIINTLRLFDAGGIFLLARLGISALVRESVVFFGDVLVVVRILLGGDDGHFFDGVERRATDLDGGLRRLKGRRRALA